MSKNSIIPYPEDYDGGVVGLFAGQSGSGKTHLAVSYFNAFYRNKIDIIILISPSYTSQRNRMIWSKLKCKKLLVYMYYSEALLEKIWSKIPKDGNARLLIIFDDCVTTKGFGKGKQSDECVINTLAIGGKHRGVSMFVLSQVLRPIGTSVRANTVFLAVFSFSTKSEISKYHDFTDLNPKQFKILYNKVMKNHEHPFVYIYKGVCYDRFKKISQ